MMHNAYAALSITTTAMRRAHMLCKWSYLHVLITTDWGQLCKSLRCFAVLMSIQLRAACALCGCSCSTCISSPLVPILALMGTHLLSDDCPAVLELHTRWFAECRLLALLWVCFLCAVLADAVEAIVLLRHCRPWVLCLQLSRCSIWSNLSSSSVSAEHLQPMPDFQAQACTKTCAGLACATQHQPFENMMSSLKSYLY